MLFLRILKKELRSEMRWLFGLTTISLITPQAVAQLEGQDKAGKIGYSNDGI
jgi:hypothetical protein